MMNCYVHEITIGVDYKYPGKVTQQINFAGCNYNCPFCMTPQLIESRIDTKAKIDLVINEITKKMSITDALVLTGGEPLLQFKATEILLKKAREFKVKTCIKTNGSKPNELKLILKEGLLDMVELYIPSAPNEKSFLRNTRIPTFFADSKKAVNNIKKTVQILKSQKKVHVQVITNVVPRYLFRKEDFDAIAELIDGLNWYLEGYKGNNKLTKVKTSFVEHLVDHLRKKHQNINIVVQSE